MGTYDKLKLLTINVAWLLSFSISVAKVKSGAQSEEQRTKSCSQFVFSFNSYDEMDKNGKIIEKYSKFEIDNVSNDSSYEGFIIEKSVFRGIKNPILVLETSKGFGKKVTSEQFSKFEPFRVDSNYLNPMGMSFEKILKETGITGVFSISIFDGSQVVCKTTKGFSNKGD